MKDDAYIQGAEPGADGVRYRIWAPGRKVEVQVFATPDETQPRIIALTSAPDGYHEALDPAGRAGDRYLIAFDGRTFPCPASRWQPDELHGASMVVADADFPWTDSAWQRPAFRDLVIYELHIGTFTPEGTFRSAIDRLPALVDLGVNAIELMPIADFPGRHGWGYDGVRLFAPARAYGPPDDLRALVNAAHAHGLAVILDVVYNHLGPDGNYLRDFAADYFEHRHHTPWGEAINFSSSQPVRDYFRSNVVYWMDRCHIDGFRLDATPQIFDDSTPHILAELAACIHERGGYIIAEDERNEGQIIAPPHEDGGYGLDAVWADDFHHTVEVALIDGSAYRIEFAGELHELIAALEHGWVYRGQFSPRTGRTRGTPSGHLPPERFIFCISNHDQVGNRAFGDRLNHLVSPETYRAASALLCLVPYTPLLFMGQEWAASTPFLYFTDHGEELGRLVTEGRGREFPHLLAAGNAIPSPQAAATFERSRLEWAEREVGGHAGCLELYRTALRLRRENAAFRPTERSQYRVAEVGGVLALRYTAGGDDWLLLADLRGDHEAALDRENFCALPAGQQWRAIFSSNEPRFGGAAQDSFDGHRVAFQRPEVLVLHAE